jgi:CheY-like chemotaxis protein
MFQNNKYDLIFMDIQMPVMDGYAATRSIRNMERENQLPATPVIALTAHASREEIDKCTDAGCNSHLSKPVKKSTLLEALESCLSAR